MRGLRNGITVLALLAALDAHAATFVVISDDDGGDVCNVAHCSLREAIAAANLNPGADTIGFAIPGGGVRTIRPATPLPVVTGPVVIDGYTQQPCSSNSPPCSHPREPGKAAVLLVDLDGTDVGGSDAGLVLTGGDNTVRGLGISHFGGDGIRLEASGGNRIADNRISLNGRDGVRVMAGTGNAIVSNLIFDNGGLGIDLAGDGVTPNDADDADVGVNDLQNFPELTSASPLATGNLLPPQLAIRGVLHGTPHARVTLDLFADSACDPSGAGEGERLFPLVLGATTVTIPSAGVVAFSATALVPSLSPLDWSYVAATATDADGNTSEFSSCIAVAPAAEPGLGFHTLRLVSLSAPRHVKLTVRAPTKTKTIRVVVKNDSAHGEVIPDAAVLADLVRLEPDSLGGCADPVPALVLPKKFPIVLKSKATRTIKFNVPFACANDPAATTRTAAHDDYRYTAIVNHAALDGVADGAPDDDVCPRSPLASGDKGCGAKTGKVLGADVLTDVQVK